MKFVVCFPLFDKIFFTEPVGACLIVGHLKSLGIDAWVYNGFLKGESCKENAIGILENNPDIVGISMNAEREVQDGIDLCNELKQLGFKGSIVGGGAFASMQQARLLSNEKFDFVIVGDGEEALVDLILALKNKTTLDGIRGIASRNLYPAIPRRAIQDLDSVARMDREIFKQMIVANGNSLSGIQATITTGRGCFANCSFCSIQSFAKMSSGARYRERNIECIVEEMNGLQKEFGIQDFYFCSGQFLSINRRLAVQRSGELKDAVSRLSYIPSIFLYIRCDNVEREIIKNFRESGVTTLFLGVESFHDFTLQKLNKGLSSAQIIEALEILEEQGYSADYRSQLRLKLGFIMFTPWIDKEGLSRNLKFCIKFRIPPKKMLYSLQIHPDHKFPNGAFQIIKKDNVHFADMENEIGEIYRAYAHFFKQMFYPLEELRAIQKSKVKVSDEIIKKSFEIVNMLNELAYELFNKLIDQSGKSNLENLVSKEEIKIGYLLRKFGFYKILKKVIERAEMQKRYSAISSHLNRGLDNPQILDPKSVEYGLRYP